MTVQQRVRKIAPLLFVAASVLACATHPRQSIDFDTTVDFSNAKKLAFFEDTAAGATRSPGLHRDITRRAIERELSASGHSFVSPSQASLLVVYHVVKPLLSGFPPPPGARSDYPL